MNNYPSSVIELCFEDQINQLQLHFIGLTACCTDTCFFLFHSSQCKELLYLSLLLVVNSLTDAPHCRKRNDNPAWAIFVRMVPTVDHQVERERSERWDAFSQASSVGWQCCWNVSRETGKETTTMLLLLYLLISWQIQTKSFWASYIFFDKPCVKKVNIAATFWYKAWFLILISLVIS